MKCVQRTIDVGRDGLARVLEGGDRQVEMLGLTVGRNPQLQGGGRKDANRTVHEIGRAFRAAVAPDKETLTIEERDRGGI